MIASVILERRSRAEPPAGRICTAMATPFAADGSLDLEAARALARHLVEHGSEGLVLAGTTGEGPTLTDDEKLALFEAVLDEVGAETRVVANTGTYDTAHSVHLTREARRARRARLPGRHAVLQQAAGRGAGAPLRSHRRGRGRRSR